MYLMQGQYYGKIFAEANNLRAICFKEFSEPIYYDNEKCILMICQDMFLLEYKAYLKPLSRAYPNFIHGDATENDERILSAMMYGDSFPAYRAQRYFPEIDFIEGDYFDNIKNRLPEYFV